MLLKGDSSGKMRTFSLVEKTKTKNFVIDTY
uniref:Uncharacterized protein n=1 Tax=Anguilla anguilla TaxID=7936 RepID=A0A0E9VQT6_ANGAN